MSVAKEGYPFIGIAAVVAVAFALLHWWVALVIWIPILVWVVAFFRDPPRDQVRGDDLILAPADGKVVSVITIDEPNFMKGPATRVAIFMNVFSVHVNRYPTSGRIGWRAYLAGKFFNADQDKASLENEQASIGLESPHGRLVVRQIAGSIARRIVTDHGEGYHAVQGERLGLIRFGSRVDLFLPSTAQVLVKPGDHTRAGETAVAKWTT